MAETKNTWGGARAGAGRPKIENNPSKMRSMRLTDEEYDFVRWAVKQYRAGAKQLDIDNFKGVNDTLGHAYGDKVLSELGNTLKHIFTSDELIGRIGGDEFCILLNASPKKNMLYNDYVKQKCEELCDAFRRNYTGDDGKYKISGSIGVSMFPTDGSDFKQLYSALDKALYTSKRSGKDTFTFFTPDMNKEA